MNNLKNFKKVWINSLSFLDNSIVHAVIAIVLVLYCSTIFDNINSFIGNLYNFSIIKLVVLSLIVYVSPKDTTIAILLALSYVISLSYMVNNEYFNSSMTPSPQMGSVPPSPPQMGSMQQPSSSQMGSMQQPSSSQMGSMQQPSSSQMGSMQPPSSSGSKKNVVESFFPMQHSDSTSVNFDPMINKKIMKNNIKEESPEKINYDKSCMQTYTPMFESVGNVCSPTATFKNELNAQGLNYPEGFNHPVHGSPLN
jgi:hypothetical protein